MISYPSYKIIIEKKAQKYLGTLSEFIRKKIVLKIKGLVSSEPQRFAIKKLQGYKNLFRIRIDDYRIVFAVIPEKKLILVLVIGHRKDIYSKIKRMPTF